MPARRLMPCMQAPSIPAPPADGQQRAFGYIDSLTYAIGNVTGVVDDLQAVVNRDINITGFRSNIEVRRRRRR
jgi:hypothetical protein